MYFCFIRERERECIFALSERERERERERSEAALKQGTGLRPICFISERMNRIGRRKKESGAGAACGSADLYLPDTLICTFRTRHPAYYVFPCIEFEQCLVGTSHLGSSRSDKSYVGYQLTVPRERWRRGEGEVSIHPRFIHVVEGVCEVTFLKVLVPNENVFVHHCIIKLTDRGASRSYFKNFCPRPRRHLVFPDDNS